MAADDQALFDRLMPVTIFSAIRTPPFLAADSAIVGDWLGVGSAWLNFIGTVSESSSIELCDGNYSGAGKPLTVRRAGVRRKNGKWVAAGLIILAGVWRNPALVGRA